MTLLKPSLRCAAILLLSGLNNWTCPTGFAQEIHTEPVFRVQMYYNAYSAKFSPDGTKVLVSGSSATAQLIDARFGVPIKSFPLQGGAALAAEFSPDGNQVLIAGGYDDKAARLWNAHNSILLRVFSGHTDSINAAAFAPDGILAATAGHDKTVRIWNVATGGLVRTLHTAEPATSVRFSPDGKYVMSGEGPAHSGAVKIWDLANGNVIRTFPGDFAGIRDAAYSPDGSKIAVGDNSYRLRIWDVATGNLLKTVNFPQYHAIESVAFSPDGTRVACTGGDDRAVIVDVASGAILHAFLHPWAPLMFVDWSRDGTWLVVASNDGTISMWTTRNFVGHWLGYK